MSPATPEDGGDATPSMGTPIQICCPRCGFALPPIAKPVEKYRALEKKTQLLTERITPKTPAPGDRRMAPTEIIPDYKAAPDRPTV